jgi:hypothetical protein
MINKNLYPDKLLRQLKQFMKLKKLSLRKTTLPKFVFICGKDLNDGEGNRGLIKSLYSMIRSDIVVLYSELLFDIFNLEEVDLLSFEELLAELSDGIILFVESYGTACELGAFAMKDKLLKKTMIVNDKRFIGVKSFINDGPITKAKNRDESLVLYTDLTTPLTHGDSYERFENFIEYDLEFRLNTDKSKVNINTFIYELLELINILQPITKTDLIGVYKYIKDFNSFEYFTNGENKTIQRIQLKQIIDLMVRFGLVAVDEECVSISEKSIFNYRDIVFSMTDRQFCRIRAAFMWRKYKYQSKEDNDGRIIRFVREGLETG